MERILTGKMLANGLARSVFSPSLNATQAQELSTVFDYQQGTRVLHGTIQYLNERWRYEDQWLEVLGNSTVPATMIWGKKDPVAVTDVANYVWENFLVNRTSAPA